MRVLISDLGAEVPRLRTDGCMDNQYTIKILRFNVIY
ncbi:hypothetical protein JOJ88_005853 [Pantoea cypripedii]|nr:hypothetical protein [Pantoea cypripedii]